MGTGSGEHMSAPKLHVCYISGLDLRRVTPATTPTLAGALARGAFVGLRNVPGNELFPTLVTGVSPPRHGVWGVKHETSNPTLGGRLVDLVPGPLSTTWQCARHWANRRFDLAAVPPRRRRRLALTRTKYKRRTGHSDALFHIGGIPTVFDAVGADRSRFLYSASYDPVRDVLPRMARGDVELEILELYSLDRHQQWNLDREDEVLRFYAVLDAFLAALLEQARSREVTVMVVSDHGHQAIGESIDLVAILRELKIGPRHADWFIEVSNVRFWLHDDGARRALTERLAALGKGTLLTWEEMRPQGILLQDDRYGELFYYLDPGRIFFPHDFHHPLANLWLGLTDRLQRNRLRDPRHRGNHGHLPQHEAERAFALLPDGGRTLRNDGHIVDVAPSILALLGRPPIPGMEGSALFLPQRRAAATAVAIPIDSGPER